MIVIPDWAHDMTPEDFPERYQHLVRTLGAEKFLALAAATGGDSLYVPMPDYFLKPVRDKKILEEYNGRNHRQLGRKYGLSERQIRDICAAAGRPPVDDNQLQLF